MMAGARDESMIRAQGLGAAFTVRECLCVSVCVCVCSTGVGRRVAAVLGVGLSAGLIAVDGERLAGPPKWHPRPPLLQKKKKKRNPAWFASDPYTLPEHFLNLSSVFLRPKRISSLLHQRVLRHCIPPMPSRPLSTHLRTA